MNADELKPVTALEFDGAQFALWNMLGNIDADEYYCQQLAAMSAYTEQLRAQLAAVTEERDRLRLLLPSWSSAPKQATCLAMDENGRWGWHEAEPSPCLNMWSLSTRLVDAHIGAWQTSLQRRPAK